MVELVIVIAIIGSLAAIGIPRFQQYMDKIKNQKAVEDIRAIEAGLTKYFDENNTYPGSLGPTGMGNMRDPWGNPYRYLWIQGNPDPSVPGKVRLNRFNVPVNTDFDLYSTGPDGRSNKSFLHVDSRDDIVRAYNGTYFGRVSDL